MNLALFIAKRYIVSKKSNNAINIISWISVGAIAVGTGALLIILSGMNGLTNLVQGLYNSFDADIEITAAKGKVFVPDKTRLAKLSALKGIKEVCLVLEDNALLKFDDKQAVATVKGVSENYVNMSRFDTLIYEGSFFTRENNKVHAVFGKGLAFRLGTGVKDVFNPVSVYAPIRGAVNSLNPEDAFEELKVYPSGVYTINDDFDFKYMLTSISAARRLFGYTEEVSSLELGCETGADLEQVQHDLEDIMGNAFVVKNRFQQNEVLFKSLKTEKLATFIILVFILIIGTFNIIGALTMLIIEKKKDIIILNNMGADNRLIRRIFMLEGFLITVSGAFIGLFMGLLLCWLQHAFGLIRFDAGYVVEAYPVEVRAGDLLAITAVVMLIGFFAAWYPVRIFTRKNTSAIY